VPDSQPLSPAAVVETLVGLDLVDLDADGPWPSEPDDADAYEPDWSQVHPSETQSRIVPDMPAAEASGNRSAINEVQKRAGGGFLIPPPNVLDALAWYTPVHFFGLGMAIYIRESAVFDVAVAIWNRLDEADREAPANALGACRAAMSVLYLHEAFHHKIESLAIRYEIVERSRRYIPYSQNVVIPLLRQGSDEVLEETLACAEMFRRFKGEDLYTRGISRAVRSATLAMLPEWFESLPPSYKKATGHLDNQSFDRASKILMSQVQEATSTPYRRWDEWTLAPHMLRGLFNCQSITHVLVPVGESPILPWIGHAPALPSVSSRKAIRTLEREGWQIAAGRGKGSHIRLRRDGRTPLTIPANRESLSPGIVHQIAHAMGVRAGDLRF
jgi:predicted RNA binding protein YcfA (HicA-like mRNA interferase family)